MAREKSLEIRFRDYVRSVGGHAIKFVSPGLKGLPDRIVLLPGGRIGFAELKHPSGSGRVSDSQKRAVGTLGRLGFAVIVSCDFAELKDWVDGL